MNVSCHCKLKYNKINVQHFDASETVLQFFVLSTRERIHEKRNKDDENEDKCHNEKIDIAGFRYRGYSLLILFRDTQVFRI